MSTELRVLNSVCSKKDISVLLSENVDDLFIAYGDVWSSLKDYYMRHRAVPDIDILIERFPDLDKVETKAETAYYLDELKQEYLNGRMQTILLKASEAMEKDTAPRVLSKLNQELAKLSRYTNSVRDLDLMDYENAEQHYAAVRERSEAMGGSPGILTTFKSIDSVYPTGMAPGHLIVAIGWPGKFKTWFTSLLACKAWEQGFKPMIVSLEMSPEGMRDRIYTMMASGLFRNSDFGRGDINIDDFRSWSKKRFDNKRGFIVVSNEGLTDVTPATVQGKIDQHKPDLVICDYHQLFMNNGKDSSPIQRGKEVSREFKLLAVTNNLPLIDITAATADDVSDRDDPPMMSQVAWSKSIEYDADLAFAVHHDQDSGLVEIVSRKNRWGGDFDFFLDWDADRGVIEEKFDL